MSLPKFEIFLTCPNYLITYVLSRSLTLETTRIQSVDTRLVLIQAVFSRRDRFWARENRRPKN